MADPMDWHLQQDESGDVFIHFSNESHNLGPRDDVFTRLADFMGEDVVGILEQPGYDEHEDPGDFGETKPA